MPRPDHDIHLLCRHPATMCQVHSQSIEAETVPHCSLDLKQAFDRLPRDELMRGLKQCNCPDKIAPVLLHWLVDARYELQHRGAQTLKCMTARDFPPKYQIVRIGKQVLPKPLMEGEASACKCWNMWRASWTHWKVLVYPSVWTKQLFSYGWLAVRHVHS